MKASADAETKNDRLGWFTEARFGLSLHFGLYTIPARGEWVRSIEQMPAEDYQAYFDSFDPEPDWATNWARMAKKAGARYAVLTTKHHDGFCLFDSALTDFKATNTPCRRDLVREFVDAVRAEGLRVGLYYSLVDWHHPDYPAAGDRQHPLRHHASARQRDAAGRWERYVEYLHGQVEELCSNYRKIDLLVFDFSYWDFVGEKWGATRLRETIRRLQPDCLVNDRMANEALKQADPPAFAGDYEQCEQNLPREALVNARGDAIPWEGWITLNNSWCFHPNDRDWKPARTVVHALVNCVSKGGNLLLNVSPDARGRTPAAAEAILGVVGEWLGRNGESIFGAGPTGLDKPEWGRFTQRKNILYAHVLDPVVGHVCLPGLRGRVTDGRLLAHGSEVALGIYWNTGVQTFDGPDDIFFNHGKPLSWTFPSPDPADTVVRFRLTDDDERKKLCSRYEAETQRAAARVPF